MSELGLEPPTSRLRVRRDTTELLRSVFIFNKTLVHYALCPTTTNTTTTTTTNNDDEDDGEVEVDDGDGEVDGDGEFEVADDGEVDDGDDKSCVKIGEWEWEGPTGNDWFKTYKPNEIYTFEVDFKSIHTKIPK
uniref:Uncharacterized protein n=1 Tax=Cacopsylla melanoneura TaxID=428564 RepID=A0A8D8SD83_9HEMI